MRKLVRVVGLLIYLVCVAMGLPLALWLIFNAVTFTGHSLAIVTIALIVLPVVIALWVGKRTQRIFWGTSSIILVSVVIGFSAAILLTTPSGIADPGSPVQHRFTHPTRFPRYALTNLIPEIEQINLGFQVMPYLDPILTVEQSRSVLPLTLDIYTQLERDPNFYQMGSAMGWAYAELFGLPFDVGHYYLYIPDNQSDEPLPVIVFLHGSAGNFKAYTWIWSHLAKERNMVIIAPSFGFGNWRQPGGSEAVLRAIEDAASQVEIDRSQIYLAGLSNGGLGVSELAVLQPEMFRGLIFLSPVMDTSIVDSADFQQAWQNRPVLVISGEVDRRIPLDYVQQRIRNLGAGGVDLMAVIFPGEDHFLFFSQPDRVLDEVSIWLEEIKEVP